MYAICRFSNAIQKDSNCSSNLLWIMNYLWFNNIIMNYLQHLMYLKCKYAQMYATDWFSNAIHEDILFVEFKHWKPGFSQRWIQHLGFHLVWPLFIDCFTHQEFKGLELTLDSPQNQKCGREEEVCRLRQTKKTKQPCKKNLNTFPSLRQLRLFCLFVIPYQSDQMRLRKNFPRCIPTHFLS
jgi:hypothetical protein